jgi:competence protein ComEA
MSARPEPTPGSSVAAGAAAPAVRPRALLLGLAFLLGVFAILLGQQTWARLTGAATPADLTSDQGSPAVKRPGGVLIDINEAAEEDLRQVQGIGPVLARRIVEDRERRGRFQSMDDVGRVAGVGRMTLERLRARAYVTPAPADFVPVAAPAVDPRLPSRTPKPVDLNRATRQELIELPAIGPALADRILADREANGPYRRVEDITRISGIKGKTLEKVREFVFVTPPP